MLECNSCHLAECQSYLLMQLTTSEPAQGRHSKSSVFKHLLDDIHKGADMDLVINPRDIYTSAMT